ncbi:MAG: ZIP family metal transporter [Ruminococcus sp.]|nr:ZIP family metal transporter [Ruminococcus sp.]
MNLDVFAGIMIPFVGTTLGAAMVFFLKKEMNLRLQKALLGFAAGVMVAASVWSLLLPAIDMAQEQGKIAWVPATVGFFLGVVFLMALDALTMRLTNKKEGRKGELKSNRMLIMAVTLHNIPEGMVVGVTFAGLLAGNEWITLAGCFALAIGIAVQNFPEGAIISMPLTSRGMSRKRAFLYGTASGVIEPIAAFFTLLLTRLVSLVLSYLLAFAAGAMIYVVVEELIPESQEGEYSSLGTIGVTVGFLIMMILDVALG